MKASFGKIFWWWKSKSKGIVEGNFNISESQAKRKQLPVSCAQLSREVKKGVYPDAISYWCKPIFNDSWSSYWSLSTILLWNFGFVIRWRPKGETPREFMILRNLFRNNQSWHTTQANVLKKAKVIKILLRKSFMCFSFDACKGWNAVVNWEKRLSQRQQQHKFERWCMPNVESWSKERLKTTELKLRFQNRKSLTLRPKDAKTSKTRKGLANGTYWGAIENCCRKKQQWTVGAKSQPKVRLKAGIITVTWRLGN
jgi:hypothetical protein